MTTQSNVIPLKNDARDLRRARGQFVKNVMDAEERSARFVAIRIGLNPTSMGERLRGKSPFLADELESIARVLKIDPVEFYRSYISVTSEDPNPRTLVPKVAGSTPVGGTVIPFPTRPRPDVKHKTPAPVVSIARAR